MKLSIPNKFLGPIKLIIAAITSFFILIGANIIVNLLILRGQWKELLNNGIIEVSSLSFPMSLLSLLMITFFIFELNRKIPDSSLPIGLVISLIVILPLLVFHAFSMITLSILIWLVITNILCITLASYVFEMMSK